MSTASQRWVDVLAASLPMQSHRRRNALTGDWVLVSPHRTQRPWLGHRENTAPATRPRYDASCYLCPGNIRANGMRNPPYEHTFVFTNDFPALEAATASVAQRAGPFAIESVSGECRVICYSPRHDLSFGELDGADALAVVRCWRDQFEELNALESNAYTLIFENRGEAMGASNPHPHGQLWTTSVLPNEIERELEQQESYRREHGGALLSDYLEAEIALGTRIVQMNEHWAALVPHWAAWPFELLILPRRPIDAFSRMTTADELTLAALLQAVIRTYDRLFSIPFPYSMGWHPRPRSAGNEAGWILHAHFYPPLLRSAHIRKFQVGFEMLGMPQRDLTPEAAAERLRAVGGEALP
jgi:UDPglucose--hexose-1-phosphate uridylyltransferase